MSYGDAPKRQDIPDDTTPADVLHELRVFIHDVDGDLRFLHVLRILVTSMIKTMLLAAAVAAPLIALAALFR